MSSRQTPSSRSSAERVRFGGGDGLQNCFGHFKSGAVGAGNGALQRAAGAGGDMQIHLKPRADHAYGIEDAGLVVEDELAGQQMEDFAVGRALDGTGTFDGGTHIVAGNFAHAIAEIESAVGVEAANMRAANAHNALVNVDAGHALGLLVGGATALAAGDSSAIRPLRMPADSTAPWPR